MKMKRVKMKRVMIGLDSVNVVIEKHHALIKKIRGLNDARVATVNAEIDAATPAITKPYLDAYSELLPSTNCLPLHDKNL